MIVTNPAAQAVFNAEKMGKVSLAAGDHLFAGLNCFLPGQQHAPHVHANQDKLYLILEGAGTASVGGEEKDVAAGDLVFAPAGVEHGLRNFGGTNLVALVVFSSPRPAQPARGKCENDQADVPSSG